MLLLLLFDEPPLIRDTKLCLIEFNFSLKLFKRLFALLASKDDEEEVDDDDDDDDDVVRMGGVGDE